jgi:O-antigen/teichoic acid export membrane protein
MGIRQKATEGLFWSAAQTWGARAVTFVVTLVLARLVLPEAFGLVAYASVFVGFIELFLDQGFSAAIVQLPQLEDEHLDTAFWFNLLTGGLFTAVGVVVSGLVAKLFDEPRLAPIVAWLSLSYLLGAFSRVQEAILRRDLAFRRLAVRSLTATSISGVVAIIIAFLGFGVWSLVVKTLAFGLVSGAVLWRVSNWRPCFHFSRRHLQELFAFGISMVGSNIAGFLSRRSDDFLIGYFLGPVALGYYTIAYNLLMIMTELVVVVPNAVLFPAFSRLQAERARMERSFYEVAQVMSIVAFPLFLGVSILAPEVVLVLYGENWSPSIPVTQVLMLIGILHSAFYVYGSVLNATGKPSWRFGILSFIAILNVVGFAVAVQWGIVAVAAAYVIVSYLASPLYFHLVRRLTGVSSRTYIRQLVPALVSSLAMIAVMLGLKYTLAEELGLYVRLVTLVLSGAFAYLLCLRLIRPSFYRQILEYAHQALPSLISRKA